MKASNSNNEVQGEGYMSLAPGDLRISGSVGRGGMNLRSDVLLVQQLINSHLPVSLPPLQVDGNCGALTIGAIEEIQRRSLHMNAPDGNVSPDGPTFRFLAEGGVQPGSGTFPADVVAAAQASQKKWKIPAAVTLAQWALESAWGRSMPAGSNNPFGIKAAGGEPYVEAQTREVIGGKDVTVVARFRKFASLDEAFDQHGRLLATARPYAHALTLAGDPDAYADALTGVYATDPNYGTLLKRLMQTYNLRQYD